jgi:hypothetical protein
MRVALGIHMYTNDNKSININNEEKNINIFNENSFSNNNNIDI